MENLGSTWNKWDLHIHTPCSLTQQYGGDTDEVWEKFISDIEKLPAEIRVIGINDYWFLDGYRKVINFKTSGRLKNIQTIFPVCEFRIKKFSGVNFGKLKRINLHVIFSPLLSHDIIQAQFLDTLQSAYCLDSENNDDSWLATITKSSLIDLGKKIKQTTPHDKVSTLGSDIEVGFNNLNIDEERILRHVKTNTYLKGKCFLALGKTEWADLTWTESIIAEKKDIINKVNFVFTAINTVEEFNKSKDTLKAQNVNNLLLDCSDAHCCSTQLDGKGNLVKDRIGNVLTWIKAEPTFEGLRQVLYEQDYRIVISDNAPREPIRKIEKVEFNFPETIKIKRHDSSLFQDLCIKNVKEINFSPYFTCLIGGRGTGKSTIINIIAEKLGAKTDFFDSKQNGVFIADSHTIAYDLRNDKNNYIQISGSPEIEFISQGTVEKLTDGEKLTHLIFQERVLQPNTKLQEFNQNLNEIVKTTDIQINLIFESVKIQNDILVKTNESKDYESVINSINDPIYLRITNKISSITKEIASIDGSKLKYENLLKNIKSTIQSTVIDKDLKNEYESRLVEIINHLSAFEEFEITEDLFELKLQSFIKTDDERNALDIDLIKEKEELAKFFTEKGTSQESINDSQSANENLARIHQQIKVLDATKNNLILNIENNKEKIDAVKDIYDESTKLIKESILQLNHKLKVSNENVSPIKYEYDFNKEGYNYGLFEEFQTLFKSYHISGTSWPNVREVLFSVKPDNQLLLMDYVQFSANLKNVINRKFSGNNNYVKMILNIFALESNFDVYKYLVRKHLYNIFEYINIKGYYGKRDLDTCSFGQKCTAVIVTLLMTGVKPLIIDEPEAHLDNRLIADYLVDLIKEKKSDRQIIFATHNANFVVNGDAELIHILEIPEDDNFTTITPTTIENISNRDKLLKLEGGRDAFEKREHKLLIR